MVKRLADRLETTRHELFVGRAAEKALFEGALRGDSPLSVLHIHGPGGVGKTTLLHQCAALAQASNATVVTLDARNIEVTPDSFVATLVAALGVPIAPGEGSVEAELEALGTHIAALPGRCVILVDTYELLTPLDNWLRETLLPSLPDSVLFVPAGRQTPSLAWSGDGGWNELWRDVPLLNLDEGESRDYLGRRHVPDGQHGAILNFTYGHPLALSLIADLFSQRRFDASSSLAFIPEAAPEVVNSLLNHLLQHEPDALHRAALQACALVRVTTEDLLAHLLDLPDAHASFEWLRSLSFIETGRYGLFPHDMAREVLLADLRWRNPSLHRDFHSRARVYYAARTREGDVAVQQHVLFDYVFLHRNNPVVRPFMDWRETGTLLPGPARPDEMQTLAAIVKRHEGAEAARHAALWFAAQPRGVLVLRDAAGQAAGFLALVSLSRATAEQRNHDPATRAAWQYLESHAPMRSGEDATVVRFWMSTEHYQDISPEQSLIFIHTVRHYLTAPGLAFSFFVCADPEFWAPILNYAGAQRVPADFEVGGKKYGFYAHDWRVLPPLSWLEMLGERELATEAPPENAAPLAEVEVLRREEFDSGVQHALRDIARPHALRNNALLRSRIVAQRAGHHADHAARATALQSLVHEACNTLRAMPRENKFYRALDHTYLHPAPTQERAAELMDLPFSTFRRHLKSGIAAVSDLLWRDEIGG